MHTWNILPQIFGQFDSFWESTKMPRQTAHKTNRSNIDWLKKNKPIKLAVLRVFPKSLDTGFCVQRSNKFGYLNASHITDSADVLRVFTIGSSNITRRRNDDSMQILWQISVHTHRVLREIVNWHSGIRLPNGSSFGEGKH